MDEQTKEYGPTKEYDLFDVMRLAALFVFGVTVSIGGCCLSEKAIDDNAVMEMVTHGSDPIAAGCAVGISSLSGVVCARSGK